MGEGSNKVPNTWVKPSLGQWLHQEHQQAWGNTWTAPFTCGNTLPPPNAPHTQFTFGRNQATTATAGRQSCSSAAKRETNVTHLYDKDWGKVALPGPGWWRTREASTTQGAEAHASIPAAPPCPMQLTQASPIPHLDTPPIHLSYLSSSPRSYPPATTMQQSPALLTQANCPYTTFCLFCETEGWGFTLNHHSFVKLPKTSLNKTFWRFEWGGSPHFKIKCNGRPLTFLAAYFAGNTCPPPAYILTSSRRADVPWGNLQSWYVKVIHKLQTSMKDGMYPQEEDTSLPVLHIQHNGFCCLCRDILLNQGPR